MQAMVGVAFSLGFLFGPMIGAAFSVLGRQGAGNADSFTAFQYPAIFALTMAVIDVVFLLIAFQETLPGDKRVRDSHVIVLRIPKDAKRCQTTM